MPRTTPCVHLHAHSHFSLLDGNPRVEALVKAAADAEMPALALTDHGNLFGIVELFRYAEKHGVKPIPGIEAYIARTSHREKSGGATGNFTDHITLLATNYTGYQNLMKLTSRSFLEGFHRKPRIDKELLDQHREGLIALSGCLSGEISRMVLHGDRNQAIASAQTFRDLMGPDNFYLEAMNNGLGKQTQVREALLDISKETGIPIVGTSDVHYIDRQDALAQEVMLCINMGTTLNNENRMRMDTDQFYFRTGEEMARAFADIPGALERTLEIADRVKVELPFGERHLPDFETPDGSTPSAFFRRLCDEGIRRLYGNRASSQEVQERLQGEVAVIEEMGFVSYFLITWDFIRFARENGIPVGPGRGSAAGSLVSYALGITQIDPLKYDLLFERFLNSSRISMPDIDIDFCRDGREKVIDYVRQRYGTDKVSQIVTFGTMAARAALRDAGRVLEVDLKEVDRIAKKIPGTPGTKLDDALQDPELQEIHHQSELHEQLFDVALKLEGLNRHASTHAAGVVIGDQPLLEIVPLCRVQGEVNTQFTMNDLEALGLLKMDFLGLKTLTILDGAVKMIRENQGIDIDCSSLPLDDKRTYQLLAKGETAAVFQLESSGMRELLVKMDPGCFEDIIAILALYRPGPLGSGMVDSYVNRKRGVEEIRYLHPVLEDVLQETYGILVYQEQVMRITNVLSGFTLNEADSLRKAMGKKKPEVMAKFKQKFVEGAEKNNCSAETATEIWELMEYFAGYGFNKSHSTAYGLITYYTAWMKANYPLEFMASVISCEVSNSDKVAAYLQECRRMKIEILPPCLLHSQLKCSTEEGSIRLGLSTVKGIGERAIEALIAARTKPSQPATFGSILEETDPQSVNKSALEALIKAGALDWAPHSRNALFQHLPVLMQQAAVMHKDRKSGQGSLFGNTKGSAPVADRVPDLVEWSERELLHHEKEVFGFYLSSNPLTRYTDLLRRHCNANIADLNALPDNHSVTVGGIAGKPRITVTKKGKTAGRKMAIVEIFGDEGSVSCVIFPDVYEEVRAHIEEDRILILKGQLDLSRDDPTIKVAEVVPLDGILDQSGAGQIIIDLPTSAGAELPQTLQKIRDALLESVGENPVFVRLVRDRGKPVVHRVDEDYFVKISDDLVEQIERIVGSGRVSLM